MSPEPASLDLHKVALFERALPGLIAALLAAGEGFDDAPVAGSLMMDILVARAFGDVWDISSDIAEYLPTFMPHPKANGNELAMFNLHMRAALRIGDQLFNSDGVMDYPTFCSGLLGQVSEFVKIKQQEHPEGTAFLSMLKPVNSLVNAPQWDHDKIAEALLVILAQVEADLLTENTTVSAEGSGRSRL